MATFKAVVNCKQVKEDKTWKVRIRITHNRVLKYIQTAHHVTKSQLDKNFEIKDPALLHLLSTQIAGYRAKVDTLSAEVESYTCEELRDYVTRQDNTRINYIEFAQSYIAKIKVKGSQENAYTTLNSFIDFIGPSIDINRISLKTLLKYEEYLRSPRTITRRNDLDKEVTRTYPPVSDTAVKDYMSKLKKFYKEAMIHYNEREHVYIPFNPFDNYVAPKQVATADKNLPVKTIIAIRDCPEVKVGKYQRSSVTTLAREISMLSFYLIGMNAVDLYNVDSYENGRISYNRAKTSSRRLDKAYISIKVEPEALILIEKYKDLTCQRVFNFYQTYSNADALSDALNRGLKPIAEHLKLTDVLTYYWGRYSWPNIARNDCRIAKDDIAQAINHSDEQHKTTDIYLTKNWDIIDDANRKVLNMLLPKTVISNDEDITEFMEDINANLDSFIKP